MDKRLENRIIVICLSITTVICLVMLLAGEHIKGFWGMLLLFTFLQWVSLFSKKSKKLKGNKKQ